MENSTKWLFNKRQIMHSPSRRHISFDKETKYRHQCSSFIQDLGQSLRLSQLSINTALVYMHRFYMFHSMIKFDKYKIGIACLFLSTKTEETTQRIDVVIQKAYKLLYKKDGTDTPSQERYTKMYDELIFHENLLLMTLGFDVQVHHPHPIILKACELIKANKELKATSYFLASNSIHLTTMCLEYRPSIVACLCIHFASKWACYEIPLSAHGRPWYTYIDPKVTVEFLDGLTSEFLNILEHCHSKLKRAIETLSVLHPQLALNHKILRNSTNMIKLTEEAKLEIMPQNIKTNELKPFALTLKPKSILSPGSLFNKEELAIMREPIRQEENLLCKNMEPIKYNDMKSVDSSQWDNNSHKRKLSIEDNCSQKRFCISSETEQALRMRIDISTILKSTLTPDPLKFIDILNSPPISTMMGSNLSEIKKPKGNHQSNKVETFNQSSGLQVSNHFNGVQSSNQSSETQVFNHQSNGLKTFNHHLNGIKVANQSNGGQFSNHPSGSENSNHSSGLENSNHHSSGLENLNHYSSGLENSNPHSSGLVVFNKQGSNEAESYNQSSGLQFSNHHSNGVQFANHHSSGLGVSNHQSKEAEYSNQSSGLQVTNRQSGGVQFPIHHSIEFKVSNHQLNGFEVSNHHSSGLQVPSHQSSGLQVSNLQSSGLQISSNRSSGLQVASHQSSGLQVPNHQSSGLQVPNHQSSGLQVSYHQSKEVGSSNQSSGLQYSSHQSNEVQFSYRDLNGLQVANHQSNEIQFSNQQSCKANNENSVKNQIEASSSNGILMNTPEPLISTTVDSEKDSDTFINVTDISDNTVDASNIIDIAFNKHDGNNNYEDRKKRSSKKSKREKSEKKTDKRDKIDENKRNLDKKGNNLKVDAKVPPIKISIPREKLNLSNNLIFSGSKVKTSQESSLKIKIPKKMILDTKLDSPSTSETVKASLSLQISRDMHERNTNKMTWMTQQRMQPVFNRY